MVDDGAESWEVAVAMVKMAEGQCSTHCGRVRDFDDEVRFGTASPLFKDP
jgi:hypothetical protein